MQVGSNYFRIHPKGVGLLCARQQGLPSLTFVEEYLGEVHAPWRWFEMQVGDTCFTENKQRVLMTCVLEYSCSLFCVMLDRMGLKLDAVSVYQMCSAPHGKEILTMTIVPGAGYYPQDAGR